MNPEDLKINAISLLDSVLDVTVHIDDDYEAFVDDVWENINEQFDPYADKETREDQRVRLGALLNMLVPLVADDRFPLWHMLAAHGINDADSIAIGKAMLQWFAMLMDWGAYMALDTMVNGLIDDTELLGALQQKAAEKREAMNALAMLTIMADTMGPRDQNLIATLQQAVDGEAEFVKEDFRAVILATELIDAESLDELLSILF